LFLDPKKSFLPPRHQENQAILVKSTLVSWCLGVLVAISLFSVIAPEKILENRQQRLNRSSTTDQPGVNWQKYVDFFYTFRLYVE
jgi:hypothetical protein